MRKCQLGEFMNGVGVFFVFNREASSLLRTNKEMCSEVGVMDQGVKRPDVQILVCGSLLAPFALARSHLGIPFRGDEIEK